MTLSAVRIKREEAKMLRGSGIRNMKPSTLDRNNMPHTATIARKSEKQELEISRERDSLFLAAKLADQAREYSLMKSYMSKAIHLSPILTKGQQSLFTSLIKGLFGPLRSAGEKLKAEIMLWEEYLRKKAQKEMKDRGLDEVEFRSSDHSSSAEGLRHTLLRKSSGYEAHFKRIDKKKSRFTSKLTKKELEDLTKLLINNFLKHFRDIIDLTENHLLPDAIKRKRVSEVILYQKIIADQYRFMLDLSEPRLSIEIIDPTEAKKYQQASSTYYQEAFSSAEKNLRKTDPLFLSLVLSYALLMFHHLRTQDQAVELVVRAHDDAGCLLQNLTENEKANTQHHLNLLQRSMSLWAETYST